MSGNLQGLQHAKWKIAVLSTKQYFFTALHCSVLYVLMHSCFQYPRCGCWHAVTVRTVFLFLPRPPSWSIISRGVCLRVKNSPTRNWNGQELCNTSRAASTFEVVGIALHYGMSLPYHRTTHKNGGIPDFCGFQIRCPAESHEWEQQPASPCSGPAKAAKGWFHLGQAD